MVTRVECSHCRHVNVISGQPQDNHSCQHCGRPLAICPQCGQPRSPGAVICINCGLDFRTGKKVVASPEPQQFGDFSLYPIAPGEWLLSMRYRFLGIPLGTREYHIAGFDKVYYDTIDAWTQNVGPTASPDATKLSLSAMCSLLAQLFQLLVALSCGLVVYLVVVRLSGDSDAKLLFEVGFLGPRDRFLRLTRSRNSANMREVAAWLSETLALPIERRDRRSPD